MSVYLKLENGELISAQNGYNGVVGLADSVELCSANGFVAYNEAEYTQYLAGQRELMPDGTLRDLTQDASYIADRKSKRITEESEKWAQEERKYMQLISKTNCCGQTAAQNAYKTEYQTKKQAFLNLVIAIRKGEA